MEEDYKKNLKKIKKKLNKIKKKIKENEEKKIKEKTFY